MATLLSEFKSITEALNDAGLDYAVCGGWAMAIHGIPRSTLNIDLLALTDDLDRVWEITKDRGYDDDGMPLHFADGAIEIRRISKVDSESKRLFTLDLLLVTPKLEEVWRSRGQVEWEEGQTWVVGKAGLIDLTQISRREQDLLDIEVMVDMSPRAVAERLRLMDELWELSVKLMNSKKLSAPDGRAVETGNRRALDGRER
ncbi:MAG: hypothetical protein H0U23_13635 [Blastocatellia bacterium]|nr:hypothetical protein [Blastocatellia bacterium]